ncbi:MAG TPA: hypothetical protein VGP23_00295 [Candidatus Binataceae bacterium]|jgi:hypothetical protein|nr:hypothetical protein [Candidatus Binataceae bacterium]
MTHSDSEREDANLRAAGFDPAAPPAEALARLGELRAAPGVSPGAIARALGAIASAESAAMLAAMEAGASGALRRDVRRALFRLGQRGIAPAALAATPARTAASPPAAPGLSALFSPVDADGARVVWLVKERRGGGLARLWGLLAGSEGLIDVALSELSRRELRTERAEMERRAGVTMVEGDAGLADYILCEAFRRTPADRRAQVGNFLTLRTEIVGSPPPTEIVHPIYAEMASALEHEPAADLLKEPEIAAWKFPPAEIKPYVDEIKSIRESVLVLNRVQQEERINVIVERAVGVLLGGQHAGAVRRRLEDIAYYMARSGRREAAGWAAAAAARLRDADDVGRIVFFQALIRAQLGAVFAAEQERAREEPRLIMTPAEAMRAQQQQARPRRR